jgi:hypothetical protein
LPGGVGHAHQSKLQTPVTVFREGSMPVDRIVAEDGASIVVRSIGAGPGVVILHGAA